MIKAVIFDVDGTLLDTERIYMDAWRQAGNLFGYSVPDELLLQTRAVSKSVSLSIWQKYFGDNFPFDAVREERILIAERIIGTSSVEALVKPGAAEVLHTLKARGLAIGVASSTGQEKTRAHLERTGLLDMFSAVVGGDMVTNGKPAPDSFLLAASLMDAAPCDCVVVGDTPADVCAAVAAGMPIYLIPDRVPANEKTTALSRRVLPSITQLLAALDEDMLHRKL